jgi:hypothetical protein
MLVTAERRHCMIGSVLLREAWALWPAVQFSYGKADYGQHVITTGRLDSVTGSMFVSGKQQRTVCRVMTSGSYCGSTLTSIQLSGYGAECIWVVLSTFVLPSISMEEVYTISDRIYIYIYIYIYGAGGSVVVKALCYKPEGRGFGTRWGDFFIFT